MGRAKANEALILSRRIPCDKLVQCGFVNKVFERERFAEKVCAYAEDTFGQRLNLESMMLGEEVDNITDIWIRCKIQCMLLLPRRQSP
jgi:enoyl-CoA hydratase/carnithine racemase